MAWPESVKMDSGGCWGVQVDDYSALIDDASVSVDGAAVLPTPAWDRCEPLPGALGALIQTDEEYPEWVIDTEAGSGEAVFKLSEAGELVIDDAATRGLEIRIEAGAEPVVHS